MVLELRSAFRPLLFVLATAIGVAGAEEAKPRPAAPPAAAPSEAAYRQEIEAWRQKRVEGLKKENGWFSLVGLFWLEEGENGFGSDPKNRVVLPEGKAPAVAGTLVRRGDSVRVRVAPGAAITRDGKPVTEMELEDDQAEGGPTVLEIGPVSFFVIQRGDQAGNRVGVRVRDKKSPALASFQGLDHFPVDPSWRVEARFEPHEKKIPIPNILGMVEDTPSPGAVVFQRHGRSWRIEALEESDDQLFLIFADQTNGKETYGAGRFLVTEPPKDGKVVVDFNKAYNPPCAFTAFATCPLPPPQNRLALRVEAGEKTYAGAAH